MLRGLTLQRLFLALRPAPLGPFLRALFLLYVVALCTTHMMVVDGGAFLCAFVALSALLIRGLKDHPGTWLLIALLLAVSIPVNYNQLSNHFWLTVYTSLYLAVDAAYRRAGAAPRTNLPRALLAIVFGLATLQKLRSGYFMTGGLLGSYMLRGASLYPVLGRVYPGLDEQAEAYWASVETLRDQALLGMDGVAVTLPGPEFVWIVRGIALSVVVVEGALFLTFLLRRLFEHRHMPALVLAFLWGTFAFRGEFFFFALAAILVLFARPEMDLRYKGLLVFSALFFLSAGVAGF